MRYEYQLTLFNLIHFYSSYIYSMFDEYTCYLLTVTIQLIINYFKVLRIRKKEK